MGRLLFFDPTDPYVPVGYLPDHEQASLALVGAGDLGDLIRVPAGLTSEDSREQQVEAVLGADGSISGRFVDKRTGEALSGAVGTYRANPKSEYVKMVERWVGRSMPGATTSGVEVDDSTNEFVLRGQFVSQRFAQKPQARMLIFKAGLLRHEDVRLPEKARKYPVVLDTDALREFVRIELPGEFKVDELPQSVQIDTSFGKCTATWTVEGRSLVFKRSFEMRAQSVPPSQYSELQHFLDVALGSAEAPVVLIK